MAAVPRPVRGPHPWRTGGTVTKPDLMPLAEEERADLLALLQDLTPAQWDAQSLCIQWRVRDVATHVVSYDELSKTQTVATFLRGGLRTGKVNRVALDKYKNLDADQIIDLLARNLRPVWPPIGLQGRDRADRRHHPPPRHQTSTWDATRHPPSPAYPRTGLLTRRTHPSVQGQQPGSATGRDRHGLVLRTRTRRDRPRRITAHGRRRSRASLGRAERRRSRHVG